MATRRGGMPSGFQTLFNLGTFRELTDGRLLERFTPDMAKRPNSRRVAAESSRRIPAGLRARTGDAHDAQIFQATFLIPGAEGPPTSGQRLARPVAAPACGPNGRLASVIGRRAGIVSKSIGSKPRAEASKISTRVPAGSKSSTKRSILFPNITEFPSSCATSKATPAKKRPGRWGVRSIWRCGVGDPEAAQKLRDPFARDAGLPRRSGSRSRAIYHKPRPCGSPWPRAFSRIK